MGSGIYFHSTNAIKAILKSGKFMGSSKAGAKLGEGLPKEYLEKNAMTLFVEWAPDDKKIRESLSRINAQQNKDEIRGVLVFLDPEDKIVKPKDGGYPRLPGLERPLTDLQLLCIIAVEDDLSKENSYAKDILSFITKFSEKVSVGFYPEPTDTFTKDFERIDSIILEIRNY